MTELLNLQSPERRTVAWTVTLGLTGYGLYSLIKNSLGTGSTPPTLFAGMILPLGTAGGLTYALIASGLHKKSTRRLPFESQSKNEPQPRFDERLPLRSLPESEPKQSTPVHPFSPVLTVYWGVTAGLTGYGLYSVIKSYATTHSMVKMLSPRVSWPLGAATVLAYLQLVRSFRGNATAHRYKPQILRDSSRG
jgi:hypothetical protein